MKKLIFITLLLVAAVYSGAAHAANVKFYSTGTYVDRDNAAHTWMVNEHHTLIWDGKPYIPVGGVFYSRYICEGRNDANWDEDVKALETLKSKGITDLLLKNLGPASWVPPEAWQKLIDYLETNGFTYGLDLSDSPKGVLTGYIVRPHRYRLADVDNDGTYTFNIPDVVSAYYVLARTNDASVVQSGFAEVGDGKVTVTVKTRVPSSYVLLLYPEVDISGHGDGGIPNIWDGYDAFRDKLLAFLGKIKFGKGFRFFLDPFDVRMSMIGNLATAVPNSPGFRLEFEAWLQNKYPLPANVASSWGAVAQEMRTLQEAARLVPLWHAGKGVAKVYDPATGDMKSVTVQSSGMWEDICAFRDSSIRSYMNAVADVLKAQVANVPVVFRMGDYYEVYANNLTKGGFDGLAVDTYGRGDALVTSKVGPAYSLNAESAKTMWTIVSSTHEQSPQQRSAPGYSSREAFTADMSLLKEGGAKGVFVQALQMSPKAVNKNFELLGVPEQLDWFADAKESLQKAAEASPRIIFYPSALVSGAVSMRVGPGVWWLPSLRTGRTFSCGDEILGYSLKGDNVSYFWSLIGPASGTLKLQKDQKPLIVHPDPPDDRVVMDKERLILKLDKDPLAIRGIQQTQEFTVEIAQAEIDELDRLIPIAEKAGTKVVAAKEASASAKKVLKNSSPLIAYDMAHTAVLNLKSTIAPFAWLEGEATIGQNFDKILGGVGASFGRYILLDSDNDAPMAPYAVTYGVSVPKDATYELWLAGYVPGDDGSPMAYNVDGTEWVQITDVQPVGNAYGPGFRWTKIGGVTLKAGDHKLELKVTGRRQSDNRYVMAIDAVLLTSEAFVPSGIKKP